MPTGADEPTELHAERLRWRGVEDPCERCGGSGVVIYGSTSTWRGGMGGSKSTRDVCPTCWGSGDRHHPWTDLRKLMSEQHQQVAAMAMSAVACSAGANLRSLAGTAETIAVELDKLARGRKARPPYWRECCESLARVIRLGIQRAAQPPAPPTPDTETP